MLWLENGMDCDDLMKTDVVVDVMEKRLPSTFYVSRTWGRSKCLLIRFGPPLSSKPSN